MRSRDELTRFLKSARARISPEDVGLPAGERRRAKGLRREEVAALAGMSVTWYTWFEQGRDVQLSAAMLERLSKALRMTAEEREYLFALAQHRPAPRRAEWNDEVAPAIQQMLDSLDVPALIMTEDWTVIGWNRMVATIFRDYGDLAPEDRNLLKILLLHEGYRADAELYRAMVKRLTARFKWDYSRTARPELFEPIIEELCGRSELFDEYWHISEVVAHLEGLNWVTHPELGQLGFRHTSYAVEQAPNQRLMIFAPLDEPTREGLRLLSQRMPAAVE